MENSITVAILTYNRPDYLATALRSACNQQLPPAEILVIDDGSTEETKEVVDAFCKHSSRIRYVWQENGGHSAARNRAVKECRTSHLLWLDDDDALTSNAVASQWDCLQRNPDADIIYGLLTLCDQRLVPIEPMPCHKLDADNLIYLFFKHNPVPNPGTLISMECFKEVGPYNKRFRHAEDYDFYARAASMDMDFVCNESMLIFYRSHPSNLATSAKLRHAEHERVWVIESLFERENIEDIFYLQPWENLPDRATFNSCLEAALLFCRLGAFENAAQILNHSNKKQFEGIVTFLLTMIEAVKTKGAQGLSNLNHSRALFEGPGEQLLDVLLERTLSAEEMDSYRAELIKAYLERARLEDLYTHLPWEEQPELALLSACIEHTCRCVRYGDFEAALGILSRVKHQAHVELAEFIMALVKAFQSGELESFHSHPFYQSDAIAQLRSVFQERSERYRIIERERLFSYENKAEAS